MCELGRLLFLTGKQNEVLHSHPIASIPKSVMKAPPLDTANPSPAHSYLLVPAASAKAEDGYRSRIAGQWKCLGAQWRRQAAAWQIPARLGQLGEQELDSYFTSF